MKHILLLAFASLLMFACSNNDTASTPKEEQEGSVTFEVRALGAGEATKRPLYDQDTVQAVTRVNVYVFKKDNSNNYLYLKTIPITWSSGTYVSTYTIPTDQKLPLGDYKFIATGQESSDSYVMPILDPSSDFTTVSVAVTNAGNEKPNEFFSGTSAYTIGGAGGARIYIPMYRNVAGVLGYFKNVPATYNGTAVKYLKLTITNANKSVNLSTGVASDPIGAPLELINIDLSGQTILNGIYTGIDLTSQGVVTLPNSQLNGCFVIPVTGIQMTLGLYDASGNSLKEWTVKDEEGNAVFDVVANEMFSLGQKIKAGDTNGGTPTPPGTTDDDDNAIDLLIDQEIKVHINASWGVIHNMTIN